MKIENTLNTQWFVQYKAYIYQCIRRRTSTIVPRNYNPPTLKSQSPGYTTKKKKKKNLFWLKFLPILSLF